MNCALPTHHTTNTGSPRLKLLDGLACAYGASTYATTKQHSASDDNNGYGRFAAARVNICHVPDLCAPNNQCLLRFLETWWSLLPDAALAKHQLKWNWPLIGGENADDGILIDLCVVSIQLISYRATAPSDVCGCILNRLPSLAEESYALSPCGAILLYLHPSGN